MSPRDFLLYLNDILISCNKICTYTAGKNMEDYAQDDLLRSAVEREFSIIGEAVFCAGKQRPELAQQIPQIVALRHRLIHGYFSTSAEIMWRLVKDNIPTHTCPK